MRRGWLVSAVVFAVLSFGVPAMAATHPASPKPSSSGGGTSIAVYVGAIVAGAVVLGLIGLYGLYRTRDPLR